VAMDMSAAYMGAVRDYLPDAAIGRTEVRYELGIGCAVLQVNERGVRRLRVLGAATIRGRSSCGG
jgi:hypothetical protein